MDNEKKTKHPAFERALRIGPDGKPNAITFEDQWNQIERWHAFLESEDSENYPFIDGLSVAWSELEPSYALNGEPTIERGAELRRVSSSPLSALFYFIEMGCYPPPELLLGLADCWDTYSANAGKLSLEESFLGRSIPKAGNYAARSSKKFVRIMMRSDFEKLIREGCTRKQAAEAVSKAVGGKPEPESILRMFRGSKVKGHANPEK